MGYLYWGLIDILLKETSVVDKSYGFIYVDSDNEGSGIFERNKKT